MNNQPVNHLIPRRDRLLQEWRHDPYQAREKPPGSLYCSGCGAAYQSGRWQWVAPEAGARDETCPACRRIRDRCPAGFLTMTGEFLCHHHEEILSLVHHVEEREKAAHPLKRIMGILNRGDDGIEIRFTDPQLAHAAGEALHHAYQGTLDYEYQEGEYQLRVTWTR